MRSWELEVRAARAGCWHWDLGYRKLSAGAERFNHNCTCLEKQPPMRTSWCLKIMQLQFFQYKISVSSDQIQSAKPCSISTLPDFLTMGCHPFRNAPKLSVLKAPCLVLGGSLDQRIDSKHLTLERSTFFQRPRSWPGFWKPEAYFQAEERLCFCFDTFFTLVMCKDSIEVKMQW